MEPFEDHQQHDPRRRFDAVMVWTAVVGAFVCSAAIVVAANSSEPDPVAEPVPTAHWTSPKLSNTMTTPPSPTFDAVAPQTTMTTTTAPQPATTTRTPAGPVSHPQATTAATQPTITQLWSVGEHKCLDAPTGADKRLRLHTCNGQRTQAWQRTPTGQLTVQVDGTTQCVDADGQGTRPGTKVIIWPCNGQANEQWAVNADGTITGVQSRLCLDAAAASYGGDDPITLWPCDGDDDQRWELR